MSAHPETPEEAWRARIQGGVVLEALIDTWDRVVDVRVLRSIPKPDEPSQEADCCWKHKPALWDGNPIDVPSRSSSGFQFPRTVRADAQ